MSLREVIDCQGCSLRHTIKIHFAKLREKLINRKVLRAVKVESSFAVVKKKLFNSFPLQMFIHFFRLSIWWKCSTKILFSSVYDGAYCCPLTILRLKRTKKFPLTAFVHHLPLKSAYLNIPITTFWSTSIKTLDFKTRFKQDYKSERRKIARGKIMNLTIRFSIYRFTSCNAAILYQAMFGLIHEFIGSIKKLIPSFK